MKVFSVIVLGVFALGVVTFKSVASLPKLKPTAAAAYDWHQFLPEAQKRAAAYPADDPSSAGDVNAIYNAIPPKLATNPMSPYLSLKPFLPVKPAMVAPFVDPNIFIGKKAELLNNLFGSGVAPAPADSKRALSEPEPEQEATVSAQPRLVVGPPSIWGPPAAVVPPVKPTIVPPEYWSPYADGSSAGGPVAPVVDPSLFLDKKTKFLNDLFSSLSSTSDVATRAVAPDVSATDSSTDIPSSFWLQFIPAFATPPPAPTVKPTIVPPGFWVPTTVTKPVGLFGPSIPVVDPAQFVDKKTAFLNTLFSTLNITVTPAPVTTPQPTLDPITEYQQKVADFLDKLFTAVINNTSDEATAAKRTLAVANKTATEDLKNFLGDVNGVYDSTTNLEDKSDVTTRAVAPDDSATDSSTGIPSSFWLQFIPAFATPPPAPTVKPTIVPPGFWVPTTVTKPVGLFGPSIPVVDPAQFVDKKTAFLNTLFSTLNITVTPAPVTTPQPTLDPITEYQQKVADFLDKFFTAIINNTSDEATAAKRTLAVADKTATEDLKNFLGDVNGVYDSTTNLEDKTDTRATDESGSFTRRSTDGDNDTSSGAAQQLPVDALLSAKDKVINTIISEMGGIKNNILDTLAELLAKQKEAAATSAPTKKPGPPFGPGGPFGVGGPFAPWAKVAATTTTPKPTPDPEPFQKKVEFLGQVFDTLTQLEKDVTEALNEAVSEAIAAAVATTATIPTTPEIKTTAATSQTKNGTTLIDLIRSKLIELSNSSTPSQTSGQATLTQQVPKYVRAIKPTLPYPAPTVVDPSFWIPDTAAGAPLGPDYYIGKTQSFLSKLFASKEATAGDDDETATDNKERSIKMAVHQGYQSLPPGSEEFLQAGGGSTPQKHEGGGLKLQGDSTISKPKSNPGESERRHHHNHHDRN
ncbi:uncharacterized protein LOC110840545 isoform X1 [Zootermopsis nevadensis]|uniref:uncharacterized protein LOC110840545 isoform X1 n=1 Tax=Zootermopsis nevadensis TaxID=136037 RepID=UPI000B8E48A8|nr:uncharacterized protein LOC110840545 isoform X1 [Zootermopsis nevadensis]